jgi:hypothetical protein
MSSAKAAIYLAVSVDSAVGVESPPPFNAGHRPATAEFKIEKRNSASGARPGSEQPRSDQAGRSELVCGCCLKSLSGSPGSMYRMQRATAGPA